MLPQLVGMSCAVCNQRVGSDIDGRFCEVCGNPIHNQCSKSLPGPASNDEVLSAAEVAECPRCRADPNTPVAAEVRRITLRQRAAVELAPFRQAAALYHWWKYLNGLGVILGVFVILFGVVLLRTSPDPSVPNSEAENRVFGYFSICFGLIFFAGGLFFAWYQSKAARRFHEGGSETDEPPG